MSFPSGVWGGATPVNDFWSRQFRVILRVIVYSGSWLLAIITPKYKKIEDITEVGKLRLVKSRYMLPFLLWIKRNRASAASKKILEKMIGRL